MCGSVAESARIRREAAEKLDRLCRGDERACGLGRGYREHLRDTIAEGVTPAFQRLLDQLPT